MVACGQEGDLQRYKYNFVEASLTQVNDLISSGIDPTDITLLLDTTNYSQTDITNIDSIISAMGVNFKPINSEQQFFNYLNTKSIDGKTNTRGQDEITTFYLFGHGIPGALKFGANYNITTSDLTNNLDSKAFAFNSRSWFYSCNTATGGTNSFAYLWHIISNGTVRAVEGKTVYNYIDYPEWYSVWLNRLGFHDHVAIDNNIERERRKMGFNPRGSHNLPRAAKDAFWWTF